MKTVEETVSGILDNGFQNITEYLGEPDVDKWEGLLLFTANNLVTIERVAMQFVAIMVETIGRELPIKKEMIELMTSIKFLDSIIKRLYEKSLSPESDILTVLEEIKEEIRPFLQEMVANLEGRVHVPDKNIVLPQ